MESNVHIVGDDSISSIQYLVNTLESNKPHICCATAVMTVTPQYRNRVRFLAINGSYEYSSMQIDLPPKYTRIVEKDVEKYVNTLMEQGGDLISARVWLKPKGYTNPHTLLEYRDGKWSTTTVNRLPDSLDLDAKEDVLDHLAWYKDELTLKCADIYAEVESMHKKLTYRVHLPVNYTEEEYEVFLHSLSHIHMGLDGKEIKGGYLWHNDGSWSVRINTGVREYDVWQRFTYPNVPIYLHKESSTPIPLELDVMDAHWDGTVGTDSCITNRAPV